VLTRNEALGHLNEVFVVLATTNIRRLALRSQVSPSPGITRI
jgi:hypothetical protein